MPHGKSKRKSTDYISLNTRLRKACWECVEACPEGVIGKVSILFHKHARIDHAEECKGCEKCVKTCPQQAITAYQIEKQKIGTL